MSPDQSLELGQNLEEFTVVKLLGAGGFGITYQAIDRSLQRDVAIKEYFPQQFAERRSDNTIMSRPGEENAQTFQWGLDRFLAEARTLARLDHPNVVKVSRYFESNGTAYLVMAYEQGNDLEAWLVARTEPLTEAEILGLILPLLEGLEAIHDKGLIHRDIKAQNIVIRGNGTPVLIDFGSARSVGREQTSLTTLISPGYSPPEQYSSDPATQGPWTDIYAMAGVLYRMISGSGPQDALARISSNQLQPAAKASTIKLSKAMCNAIDRGLALDVENRPKSVAEFRALLIGDKPPKQAIAASEATTLLRTPSSTPGAQKSNKVAIFAGIAAAVAVALVGAYAFMSPEQSAGPIAAGIEPAQALEAGRINAEQSNTGLTNLEPNDKQPAGTEPPISAPASEATEAQTSAAVAAETDAAPVGAVPLYSLELALIPADAAVSVGGRPYAPGMRLPPGDYALVAERSGYQSVTQEVSITGNHFLQLTLTRSAYPFTIFPSPGNARVRINNIAEVYSPGMVLPAGSYQVNVSAPGHKTWQGTINHGRAITEREVALARVHSLTLQVNPKDAQVQVDGQAYTPGMKLVTGEYQVTAKKPGFQPLSKTINLNQDRTVQLELSPSLGVLTLILMPGDARVTLPRLGRRYTPGMRLPIGEVQIRVSRAGYQTAEQEITIRPGNNAIAINLQRGGS